MDTSSLFRRVVHELDIAHLPFCITEELATEGDSVSDVGEAKDDGADLRRRHGRLVHRITTRTGSWGSKAYLVTIGINDSFDLSILGLRQLVQRTHAPVLISACSTNNSRSLTVKVSLENTRDDIDIVTLVDEDGVVAAGLGVAEHDTIWMSVEVGVAGICTDEDDVGGGFVSAQIKGLDGAAVDKRLDEGEVGLGGEVGQHDLADASSWTEAWCGCAPGTEVL